MYQGTLPARSNIATWSDFIEFIDDTTNEPFDLSTADEITVRVRDLECDRELLSASLSGGTVTLSDQTGVAAFSFTDAQMRTLCVGVYEFGTTITVDGDVYQIHLCRLPVVRGL